ncbi:3-hydroxyacyl-CoA dehydrogenase [Sphingosinicella rhizophila]|uniref:3-hydroxyacyl-CoA dehydrogenase n=1 Tax=Sphingosinicella rhizophila TaxID=3050082 RepID=A0ABU3QAA6_9SPHN|nr:3-hydroxyacyl-CoA dehydrogenase [Sphingosinicella sp. GR2756]MDT9600348.1 3-hydroxyacyl-CoA dehydrogenase [Sphingosinicella sp. GR2756]
MRINRAAIIGSGTIGRGWIPLFARAGIEVRVHDIDPASVETAIAAAAATLRDLQAFGLVEDADRAIELIRPAASLAGALEGAEFIQESVPEKVATKRAVLAQLDGAAEAEAIVSSSCSSLDPAEIFEGVANPRRCIVTHPFNPPHLMPLVEVLPGPGTDEEVVTRTSALMKELGQVPVVIRKFVFGYVANRLQAAVLDEAMSLVGDGVISPADLDLCITQALGRRWAFMGPFETADLNADEGVAGYSARYRESYEAIGADLGVARPWGEDALRQVIAARRRIVPLEGLQEKREWRDLLLMEMIANPIGDRGIRPLTQKEKRS